MFTLTLSYISYILYEIQHMKYISYDTGNINIYVRYIGVCVHAQLLSCVQLFVTPWIVARQAPLSMGFSRQEYWSGLLFHSPMDLSDTEIKPRSPALQVDSLVCSTRETHVQVQIPIQIYVFPHFSNGRDFLDGPMVKISPYNAGGVSQIPDQEGKSHML